MIAQLAVCEIDAPCLKHSGCVNAASWNDSGQLLLTGSDDRLAKIWRANSNFVQEGHSIRTGHSHNIFQCGFVPGGDDQVVTREQGCNSGAYCIGQYCMGQYCIGFLPTSYRTCMGSYGGDLSLAPPADRELSP